MSFENLGLNETILRAVRAEGYNEATPIQTKAIPPLLAGRDLIGCAQTGTGKTAAFALPMLHRLATSQPRTAPPQPAAPPQQHHGKHEHGKHARVRPRGHRVRALILSPTRELTSQIGDSFSAYGKFTGLRHTMVYGGVSQVPQVRALRAGAAILVATPGRLMDLMGQGHIDLGGVEILVLDEADRMLDMGFLPALKKIVEQLPRDRQTMMFSATMPTEIRRLAQAWLREPVHVEAAPESTPAEKVSHGVYFVEAKNKPTLLVHFLQNTPASRTLVFTRTKHGADKVVRRLMRDGINATAIHGNKSQNARQSALAQFKSSRPPVLVATDIAARGLDIDAISHVINYDMPDGPETYVHRIGRTGRAGTTGAAYTFCAQDERSRLRLIERAIRCTITVEHKHPEYPKETEQSGDNHAKKHSHSNNVEAPRPQAAASGSGRPSHGAYGQRRGGRNGAPGGAGKGRPRGKRRAFAGAHSNHSGHANHGGGTAVASAADVGSSATGAVGRSRRPGKRRWRPAGNNSQGQAN